MEITQQSNIQMSVEKRDKQASGNEEELIIREEIEGTPFVAIKENGEWFLTMGRYRITEVKETKEELKELLKGDNWEFLTTVIGTIVQLTMNENKQN